MKYYFDTNGYVHDKPTINGNPSSNNPLIYTGILKAHTGYGLYWHGYFWEFNFKRQHIIGFQVVRKVNGNVEPTSLDEIIGAVLLGFLNADHFEGDWHWSWHNNAKWYRVLQALIYCAGKDRNFFKENNVKDIHKLAYWVPPHIQYWILARDEKNHPSFINILRFITFHLWLLSVFSKRSYKKGKRNTGAVSQKNIACAILRDLKSPFFIFVNYRKHLVDYFGKNHQLVEMVEKANLSN